MILGNTASNNKDHGIYLEVWNNNNTFSGNTISNNSNGIWLSSDSNTNKIFLNHFIANEINAGDYGINNTWDNGFSGNYWDDYSGNDTNNDGIGDTPYIVPGTAGSLDNFPIWTDVDEIIPIITIIFPLLDSIFGLVAPNYNISIDELNLDTVWYSLNSGTNITFTGLTGTINQALWDALPEGNVLITFYANDSIGNLGFAEVTIKKDVTVPIITINNPQNNDIIGATAPNYNFSIEELNLDTVWYTLNDGTNLPFMGLNGTINQALWDALPEGNILIKFYANDTLGRIGFAVIAITKDVTAPIITINNPQNNDLIGATAPNFDVTIEEPNLDRVWYSLNGSTNIIYEFNFYGGTGTVNQVIWDALPGGNITIRFYASDLAGNSGFQEVTVVKEITQPSPPGIPGYDIILLVGIISVMVVIIIKKRVKLLTPQ